MALLSAFDPPGGMTDFDRVLPSRGAPSLRQQWNAFMSQCFDETIVMEQQNFGAAPNYTSQYYNPGRTDPGPTLEQEILWNAFPKELLLRYGRVRALAEADGLWPLSNYGKTFDGKDAKATFYRPLNEYCEWHVVRQPETNAILRVTFSSEPPEYWQALFGDVVQTPMGNNIQFGTDSHDVLLDLYRTLVSPDVQLKDIIAQQPIELIKPTSATDPGYVIAAGQYNIYNKWNVQLGIAHLCAPPNSLTAEVQLGGDATVLREDRKGNAVVEPGPLICCAAYGGPDRNSDPTIGAAVNALARLGALVTLRNPVGLYMDHLDVTGWSVPGGISPADCVRVLRGDEPNRMIERLVVEVPDPRYTVSDISIAGEPVRYGGQIAECITVKLTGVAAPLANIKNPALTCRARCCVDLNDFRTLNRPELYFTGKPPKPNPCPPGTVAAFAGEGIEPLVTASALASTAEWPAHRHR